MFLPILSIERTKILKQSILWWELGILAALAGGLIALLFAVTRIEMPSAELQGQAAEAFNSVTWPGAFANALSIAGGSGLGSLFVIILTGAVTAQEYHWRTLHLWLSRGVPRESYALARFAILLLPVLMFVLAALLAGGLVSLFLTLLTYGSLRLELLDPIQLLLGIFRSAYSLLPYTALAFLLAVVSRSAVVSIGVGLSLALVVENIAGQLLILFGGAAGELIKFLPSSMAGVIVRQNEALVRGAVQTAQSAAEGVPAVPALPPFAAAAGIAVYTLLFLGLAVWSLKRQDLAG